MAEHTHTHGDVPGKSSSQPPIHGAHSHEDHDHGHGEYPFLAHHFDSPQQQFDAGKLGIWLFLLTEVLFFSGLFCAYTIYRAMRPEVFVYAHYFLDTKMGALNTCVLLISSLTAAWAVRNAQLGEKNKLVLNITITIACACTFMVVKYFEYSHKFHDGLLPGRHFNPTEQVWELESFKHKHPEAAEYAERLVHEAGGHHADAPAVPAAPKAPPGSTPPGNANLSPGAAPTAGANPGVSGATEAGSPTLGATAVASAGPTPGGTAAPGSTASAPGSEAQPADAKPADAKAAEASKAAEPKAEHVAFRKPTREQLEPLLQAGVLGEKAENATVPSRPRNAHVFFSIYFFMTGLHGIHVLAGIGVFVWLLFRARTGVFGPMYFGPIDYAALYWHLVDLIWIYLFPLLYLIH